MQQTKLSTVKNIKTKIKDKKPALYTRCLLHLLDYIAIARPLLLIPVWTMVLLGYYKGASSNISTLITLPLIGSIPIVLYPDGKILITLFLFSLLMSAVYIANQITDSRTDEINGKLYLIAGGYVKKNILKIQIFALFFTSIVIAFFKFQRIYFYLIILSIVLGILYSARPIRLKGKPFWDLFANALGFGIVAFAVGWESGNRITINTLINSLPYFFCISAAFINTTIPDMEGDVHIGDLTTGAFLGVRRSCILSTILVGIVPFISLVSKDFIAFIASMVSLPFFIYMTINNWNEKKLNSIILTTKISLLVLSILVAILIPFYLILLVVTILFVKFYYQIRFNINYP